jgi:hypothetical protein
VNRRNFFSKLFMLPALFLFKSKATAQRVVVGAPSDAWGKPWTETDVNRADFGSTYKPLLIFSVPCAYTLPTLRDPRRDDKVSPRPTISGAFYRAYAASKK